MCRINYNPVAAYYDFLAKLVFGNKLVTAQNYFLNQLTSPVDILIFGGGTGCMIVPLINYYPHCRIHYLESSSVMMDKAKAQLNTGSKNIYFNCGTELVLMNEKRTYDAIITPFILDVFEKEPLDKVFHLLLDRLRRGGRWIQTDFYLEKNSTIWQRILIKLMYWFFAATTGQQNRSLPDFDAYFNHPQLRLLSQRNFISDLVRTHLYIKC